MPSVFLAGNIFYKGRKELPAMQWQDNYTKGDCEASHRRNSPEESIA